MKSSQLLRTDRFLIFKVSKVPSTHVKKKDILKDLCHTHTGCTQEEPRDSLTTLSSQNGKLQMLGMVAPAFNPCIMQAEAE